MGCCLFLLKIIADFTQTTTIDVRGFFAVSLDCGSFCIFYSRVNRGPKYNFVSSPAFGEVTGDDTCWNLIIPRSPRSLVQLWAALLGIKHPESILYCPVLLLTPAFLSSSSCRLSSRSCGSSGLSKVKDKKAELQQEERRRSLPDLVLTFSALKSPAFFKSEPTWQRQHPGWRLACILFILYSQTRDTFPLLLFPFKNSDVLPSLIWQTLLPGLLAVGSGVQGH